MKTYPQSDENQWRARAANNVLIAYRCEHNLSRDDCVHTLLTDLMHCLDRSHLNFDRELELARIYYREQTPKPPTPEYTEGGLL